MKTYRFSFIATLILALGLNVSCGKKVIQPNITPSPTTGGQKAATGKTGEKPGSISADQATLERERKLREEASEKARQEEAARLKALQEQAMREKALQEEAARLKASQEESLRDKALKEQAMRKEGLAPEKSLLDSIYFDFDQWPIRDDQQEIMLKNAEWLRVNPLARIRVEGNCDERGTAEYNLALGQKRAEAAKAFLENLGIQTSRMQTISYGFERPMDLGHNESAWGKNRRVDFVPVR